MDFMNWLLALTIFYLVAVRVPFSRVAYYSLMTYIGKSRPKRSQIEYFLHNLAFPQNLFMNGYTSVHTPSSFLEQLDELPRRHLQSYAVYGRLIQVIIGLGISFGVPVYLGVFRSIDAAKILLAIFYVVIVVATLVTAWRFGSEFTRSHK